MIPELPNELPLRRDYDYFESVYNGPCFAKNQIGWQLSAGCTHDQIDHHGQIHHNDQTPDIFFILNKNFRALVLWQLNEDHLFFMSRILLSSGPTDIAAIAIGQSHKFFVKHEKYSHIWFT